MLRKYLVAYRARSALTKNPVIRINPSFQEAKKIGILFTWEGLKKIETIQHFINELKISGKKAHVLCFLDQAEEIPSRTYNFFSPNDFNHFGSVRTDALQQFINQEFDFLFHLDTFRNIYIEYILSHSRARCRVSRYDPEKKDFYDFMIKIGENEGIEQLCRHVLHYTKSLVSHE
ncbi:MAG: hypothetical protein KFF73_19465 [Cyclobacteriaceae bacterium]|nr:hypothetical protein [Cyclobacteriaceae bacterium]